MVCSTVFCPDTWPFGKLQVGEIHHPPWHLQTAEVDLSETSLAYPYGIELPTICPHVLYAKQQDMITWPLKAVTKVIKDASWH